ncbi:activity-regulated cytoskeleton associated protein 2-like [Spodoptera frugiperda]|uniref:Activity-regulated cytoskeleton associated protein 2-like n=1 Tax=Spodoptera frugiperda TaxID=7108 RepID=A0A9R0E787_SPOFR|nr:activity-regulated cytoskeleton associated protein 2-like [Spodoptera frugiperda]
MQADTNRCPIETLRSLPIAGASWQSPSSPSLNITTSSSWNFAKCTARFTGTSQEPEVLETFIDAVQVYKECADVSDDHALRGLPMLLEGDATVWRRGTRNNVATWKDAAPCSDFAPCTGRRSRHTR